MGYGIELYLWRVRCSVWADYGSGPGDPYTVEHYVATRVDSLHDAQLVLQKHLGLQVHISEVTSADYLGQVAIPEGRL